MRTIVLLLFATNMFAQTGTTQYNFFLRQDMINYPVVPQAHSVAFVLGKDSIDDKKGGTYFWRIRPQKCITDNLAGVWRLRENADSAVNIPISRITGLGDSLSNKYTKAQDNAILADKIKSYTGTTNASGVYSVTYPVAYSVAPNVQTIFLGSNPRDVIMLTTSNTTGFTVQVQRRTDVVGLLPTYTNQSGVSIKVLVTKE